MSLGDAKNQIGYAAGGGFTVGPNLLLLYRYVDTSFTDPDVYLTEDNTYEFSGHYVGIEYGYELVQYRTTITAQVLGGMTSTRYEEYNEGTSSHDEFSDSGIAYALNLGAQYTLTQHIAPFIQVGYQSNNYKKELEKDDIKGLQMVFGVRVSLFNMRRMSYGY